MKKYIPLLCFSAITCAIVGFFVFRYYIYTASTKSEGGLMFEVKQDESIASLAQRLQDEGVIHYAWLFKKYTTLKDVDTKIQVGTYTVFAPVTLDRVIAQLLHPDSKIEREITIIPGWNLRDMAEYFAQEGIATKEEFFVLVGSPAQLKQRPGLKKHY